MAISIPKKSSPKTRRKPTPEEKLAEAKRLCHVHCAKSCVDQKRAGLHLKLLEMRPHWSVLRREEQYRTIDRGETEPFDVALPLPARDREDPEGTTWGVDLFWEKFRCTGCGRCCSSPGAGLYLEKEDMNRICRHLGWSKKRLKSLCRYDRTAKVWALKQPCPFYDPEKGCTIYPARPLTCTRYPLHPPLKEMPYNLAVDAFCPAAREFVKETLGWWIVCETNWARILKGMEEKKKKSLPRSPGRGKHDEWGRMAIEDRIDWMIWIIRTKDRGAGGWRADIISERRGRRSIPLNRFKGFRNT